MIRMFPNKTDYISDVINGFPLQVTAHRRQGILQFNVGTNRMSSESWKNSMPIDHDLEVVHPWFYSTYLIEDNIRVSFTPSKKSAIYKLEFPEGVQKNILMRGTKNMHLEKSKNSFKILEKKSVKTRGEHAVENVMSIYVYAEIVDQNNLPITDLNINFENASLHISADSTSSSAIYLKYAVSYISFDQAKVNFKREINKKTFDEVSNEGKKAWEKVINQIQVEGGTTSQKRTFYTALYRTYERMVDINEYGQYYSGYNKKIHKSDRPFYVDDWIWDTYLAHHPLRTILDPPAENDMLHSYTLMYKHSGWMPTFPQAHGNHLCMNAYHSSAIFIDGYRKGLKKV
jgi:predicted alpha-1,2-mannosidase